MTATLAPLLAAISAAMQWLKAADIEAAIRSEVEAQAAEIATRMLPSL